MDWIFLIPTWIFYWIPALVMISVPIRIGRHVLRLMNPRIAGIDRLPLLDSVILFPFLYAFLGLGAEVFTFYSLDAFSYYFNVEALPVREAIAAVGLAIYCFIQHRICSIQEENLLEIATRVEGRGRIRTSLPSMV